MAAEDYVVADRALEGQNGALTAGERVAQPNYDNPDTEAKTAADTAGVSNAAFIGYAAALATYEARADIETLADRRARENASDFADQDFMRANAYDADGSAADAPRPGTVFGDADKSA
jgi:hypothetical protein